MTDKQIIVDEINKTIEQEMENLRNIAKQQIGKLEAKLKRKEQECQQTMDNYVQLDLQRVKEYNELVDLYKAKEQECEELKKNVEHWKMEHKEAKAKGEWTYDLVKKRLGQQLDQLKAENEKLEQTLTEIKEIAEIINDRTMVASYICDHLDKILQKISEVENERN